jgi:Fe-S-cluster containining protein
MKNASKPTPFKAMTEHQFNFRCHRDISCFTKCCADLNLVLTPYDILRMKIRLGISSDAFLDRYTVTRLDQNPRFPMRALEMNRDEKRTCPFVTADGCVIYEDRPGACRIYPLGRAALRVEKEKETREKFFIVDEDHCMGFEEGKAWTPEEWMSSEGMDEYNNMNDQWLEIITSPKSLGQKKEIPRKIQMFSMASYNLDKFRRFIFESRFFDVFEVPSSQRVHLAADDVALLLFAMDWLKFSLFGEMTIKLKTQNL